MGPEAPEAPLHQLVWLTCPVSHQFSHPFLSSNPASPGIFSNSHTGPPPEAMVLTRASYTSSKEENKDRQGRREGGGGPSTAREPWGPVPPSRPLAAQSGLEACGGPRSQTGQLHTGGSASRGSSPAYTGGLLASPGPTHSQGCVPPTGALGPEVGGDHLGEPSAHPPPKVDSRLTAFLWPRPPELPILSPRATSSHRHPWGIWIWVRCAAPSA